MARTRKAAASRPRKASDDVYNARRRFRRQAERYEKKAATATGVEKSRYLMQAQVAIANALETYQGKQKPQGAVKAAAERLGVQERFGPRIVGKARETQLERLKKQSGQTLASIGRKATRNEMAREILKIGNIGSRFYGGLVKVWDATEETRRHPDRAILDYFVGADDLMDVLEQIEAAGIDIYSPFENDTEYKSIQLRVQKFILQSRGQDEEILL